MPEQSQVLGAAHSPCWHTGSHTASKARHDKFSVLVEAQPRIGGEGEQVGRGAGGEGWGAGGEGWGAGGGRGSRQRGRGSRWEGREGVLLISQPSLVSGACVSLARVCWTQERCDCLLTVRKGLYLPLGRHALRAEQSATRKGLHLTPLLPTSRGASRIGQARAKTTYLPT